MNKRENNYYDMFVQTQRCLDNYPEKWSAIPAIARYKNQLDENIQGIREKDAEEAVSTTGTTIGKNELKNLVAMKTAVVGGGIYAYANENNDPELAQIVNYSPNGLYKLADTEFAMVAGKILGVAEDRLEELSDQGINEGQLTDLKSSLDDFKERIGKPRTVAVGASVASSELTELIDRTNALLKNQLDKSMLRFQISDTAFYESYERARTIVDR